MWGGFGGFSQIWIIYPRLTSANAAKSSVSTIIPIICSIPSSTFVTTESTKVDPLTRESPARTEITTAAIISSTNASPIPEAICVILFAITIVNTSPIYRPYKCYGTKAVDGLKQI